MNTLSPQNTRSIGTPSEMGIPRQCVRIIINKTADFITLLGIIAREDNLWRESTLWKDKYLTMI